MKASLYLVATILLAAGNATAQSSIMTSSMLDIIDARSIALGESSVARAGIVGAWNSNPATLAGIDGAGGEYGHRGANDGGVIFNDYYTAGIWLGTPIGTFSLHYNRLDLEEWQLTFENGTQGSRVHQYDRTVALSYGTKLVEPIALGISVKNFADVIDVVSGTLSEPNLGSNFYIDLGFLYSFPLRTGERDSLRIGVAVQNIGGDYDNQMLVNDTSWQIYRQPVASWLRAGLSYDIAMLGDMNDPLLRGSITAEYRRSLNPQSSYETNHIGFLGGGLEVAIYDLLTLRLGAVVQAESNLYGREGEPAFRYGFGLNLPLRKIGLDLPLTFSFDYAGITLNELYVYTGGPVLKLDDLNAIGVRVAYTAPIFR